MDTAKIIEEAMPGIKDEVTRALTKSIMQSITYETTEEIRKTVVKELVEELAPKVREVVMNHRADLIAQVCAKLDEVAADVGEHVAANMRARLTKTFSSTWDAGNAVKALLGMT